MRKLIYIFLLLCSYAQAQLPALSVIPQQKSASGPFQYIDSVSITGLRTSATKSPTVLYGRTDETVTLTGETFYHGNSSTGLVTYLWSIEDATDFSVDLTGSGETLDCSSLPIGYYHITITAASLNALPPRNYMFGLVIRGPSYTEGEADLTVDLAQLQAGTWSNPLGNLDATDQGTNATLDFGEVSRPGFKLAFKNDFTGVKLDILGLVGTEAAPVTIQNVGDQVVFTQTTNGEMFRFLEGCNYFALDGKGTADEYGFKFVGRSDAGEQSQLLYFHGSFIKGVEVFACDFDQKRTPSNTIGGACLQFSPTELDGSVRSDCNGNIGDPGYYTAEYFRVFGCRILNARDEPAYIGFNEDAEIGGFSPYRTGDVWFFSNTIDTSGRDPFQIGGSDNLYCVNNYLANGGLEESNIHNSGISFNDGNRGNSYITRNYIEETDNLSSMQNGLTGNGNYFIYSNFYKQRDSPLSGTINQAIFYNIENSLNSHAEFLNNTIKSPAVAIAPFTIQYDNTSLIDLLFRVEGNVVSTSGSDQSFNAILRTVNTATTDRTGWVIDNTWRRTAQESQLKLSSVFRPNDLTSPVFTAGADATDLPGGAYDLDGYLNLTTAGCYSGIQLSVP